MNHKDFPEDAVHENGNYENKCLNCGSTFVGLKRRVMCRECEEKPTPTIAELAEAVRVLAELALDAYSGMKYIRQTVSPLPYGVEFDRVESKWLAVVSDHTAREAVEKARKGT